MPKQVLLAGCGRLGKRLAPQLAATGYAVTALSRRPVKAAGITHSYSGDLTQASSLSGLQQAFSAIIYSPTPDQRDASAYRAIYATGLKNLLNQNCLHENGHLLFISSTAVYGQNEGTWVDESSPAEPARFNGKILLEAETIAAQATAANTSVRLAGLYDDNSRYLLNQLLTGDIDTRTLQAWTNRIHLDDAAALIMHLLTQHQQPAIVNGVDDQPAQRYEVLSWMLAEIDSFAKSRLNPATRDLLGQASQQPDSAMVSGKRVSNRLARELGFKPQFPSFRHGYRGLLDRWRSSIG